MFPRLARPDGAPALTVGGESLTYRELAAATSAFAAALGDRERVAVWAESSVATCVAVIGALRNGTAVVPLNPRSSSRELEHIVADSSPAAVVASPGTELPAVVDDLPRVTASGAAAPELSPRQVGEEDTAFIVYTSGTTGPPKGVMLPRRALESNLDALASVWGWGPDDRLVHALPLFHVHGLILGVVGPIRAGGSVEIVPRFSPAALAEAVARGCSLVFAVPTMYHRLAAEAEQDAAIAAALSRARLLVSGSAPLPATEHQRLERLTGQQVVERYGLTETLMNTSTRAGGRGDPGYVGLPLPGVEVRVVDEEGNEVEADDETMGEIAVRGPNLFTGYLNRAEETERAFRDGWFMTGDMATRRSDGAIRIVGRRATDIIKSGGFKIGAGEIEAALLEHPAVAEAAVAGRPDPDLGERVEAWVVLEPGSALDRDELSSHVELLLAPHKRPRHVHVVEALPRNELGKVLKRALAS